MGCIGLMVVLFNISRAIETYTFLEIIAHPSISLLLILSLFFIGTYFLEMKTNITIFSNAHLLILFISGTYSVFDDYSSFYGLGQIVIAIWLIYTYAYLNKTSIKIAFTIMVLIYIFTIIQVASARQNTSDLRWEGAEALLFLSFFCGLIFITMVQKEKNQNKIHKLKVQEQNEIHKLKVQKQNEIHNSKMSSLLSAKATLENKLTRVNRQIDQIIASIEPFDLSYAKLTKAELKVLEVLVIYRASNAEIAERLNKAQTTVKNQIKSILDKIGADDRWQVIEMCRNNFPLASDHSS